MVKTVPIITKFGTLCKEYQNNTTWKRNKEYQRVLKSNRVPKSGEPKSIKETKKDYSPSTIQAEIPQDPGRYIFLLSKEGQKNIQKKQKQWRYGGKLYAATLVLGVAVGVWVAWLTLREEKFVKELPKNYMGIDLHPPPLTFHKFWTM